MIAFIPKLSLANFRNEEIFPDPDEFVPERWIRNAQDDIERSTDRGPFDMTAYKGTSVWIKLLSFSRIDINKLASVLTIDFIQ